MNEIEKGRKIVGGDTAADLNDFNERRKALQEFFKRRITDKDAKILVYDNWDEGETIYGKLRSLIRD